MRPREWTGGAGRALALVGALTIALALAGCGGGRGAGETAGGNGAAGKPAAPPGNLGDTSGRVAVSVDGQGFHPNRIAARAGQPITLAVTRVTNETCGTEIVIPSLGIDRALPLDETVEITITPSAKGEIAFACGMNMLKGAIVVD